MAVIFKYHRRDDIAGVDPVDILPVVGVHPQDPPNPLPPVAVGIVDIRTRLEVSGVYPEVGQLAHVGIHGNFISQGRKGLVFAGLPGGFRVVPGVDPWTGGMSTGEGR